MPLDTSIPLQAQPQQFNPLQMALQATQLRAYNTNAQSQQQQLDSNNALSAAIAGATKNGVTDWDAAMGNAAANPAAAFNLPQFAKSVQEMRQAKQTYEKGGIELNDAQIKNAENARAYTLKQFGTLDPNDPNFASKLLAIGANSVQLGHVDPKVVIASLSNVPDDPQGRAAWLQRSIASLQDPTAQLNSITPKPTQIDNNGSIQYKDTNPITNPSIVGTTINKTLTPTEAASQVAVQKPDGTNVTVPNATRLQQQGLGGLLPPNAQPQQQTSGNGRYGSPSINPEFQTTPAAGVVDANQKANAAGGDMLVADQQSNAQSGTRINMLQNAQQALSSADSGQKSEGLQNLRGALVTFGLASQEQANKVASYDEANKYLTQYAQNKAASFGHGTDSQLAAAMTGNGSTKISNLAAQDVVKVNIGLERMEQARMQAWQNSGLQPSQYAQWKSQFGSTMDPRVFIADQMDPAKVQSMVKSMNPKQQATFRTQYNWAVQNGYINGPQ